MAKVNISLNDTIQNWVFDTNTLSNYVGDITQLTTIVDSDIVGAINSLVSTNDSDVNSLTSQINTLSTSIDNVDSDVTSLESRTPSIARSSISVNDIGGDGSLSYNSASGVLTYTGPSAAEVRAHISAGAGISITSGQISVPNDGIDRAKLKDEVELIIYNSTGTAIKTLYGAGS